MFYDAIGENGAGKVLVISSNGHHGTSLGGGTKHSRLQNHQLAGLLTDGCLRDFDELRQYDFVTYCSGETVRWGGDIVMPYHVNVPVVIDKVTVMPGDYIYADTAAAVLIPGTHVEHVLREAVKVEQEDASFIEQIEREDPEVIKKTGSFEN